MLAVAQLESVLRHSSVSVCQNCGGAPSSAEGPFQQAQLLSRCEVDLARAVAAQEQLAAAVGQLQKERFLLLLVAGSLLAVLGAWAFSHCCRRRPEQERRRSPSRLELAASSTAPSAPPLLERSLLFKAPSSEPSEDSRSAASDSTTRLVAATPSSRRLAQQAAARR